MGKKKDEKAEERCYLIPLHRFQRMENLFTNKVRIGSIARCIFWQTGIVVILEYVMRLLNCWWTIRRLDL